MAGVAFLRSANCSDCGFVIVAAVFLLMQKGVYARVSEQIRVRLGSLLKIYPFHLFKIGVVTKQAIKNVDGICCPPFIASYTALLLSADCIAHVRRWTGCKTTAER